ncbi:MAG: TetR/AcrR family transcriptional regulator [Parvibaculum sp.]|nr:TetR/AcrR family transcriptional regulator [Parvibaculum sp.]
MNGTQVKRRQRLTRPESKVRTRAALLAAAQKVFSEGGYSGASLDRIAAEAGFTKGAVYAHFSSKEELFLELLTGTLALQVADLENILEAVRGAPDRIAEILEGFLGRFDDAGPDGRRDLPMLGMELQLESRRNPGFAVAFEKVIERHRRTLAAVIGEIFRLQGKAPPMPIEQYSGMLIAIVEGMALARTAGPSGSVGSISLVLKILLGLEPAGQPAAADDKR